MHHRPACQTPQCRERGATLLIGLIMLALLTMHAVAAFNTGSAQLRIAGASQARQEAQAAANAAIGRVLSSGRFLADPAAVAAAPVDIDLDDDGAGDYRVAMTASCTASRPVLQRELDPARADDVQCLSGTTFGAASLCAESHWDLGAVVSVASTAATTGAAFEVHQGTSVRLDVASARSAC